MKPSVTKLCCPLNSPSNRLSHRESQFADDAFFLTSWVMCMVGVKTTTHQFCCFSHLGVLSSITASHLHTLNLYLPPISCLLSNPLRAKTTSGSTSKPEVFLISIICKEYQFPMERKYQFVDVFPRQRKAEKEGIEREKET